MAIITRQVTANASTATYLTTVPNGVCSVTITNTGNAAVLVGVGANVTQTNAVPVGNGSNLTFQCFAASKGADLYVLVATGGSAQPVGVLISTTD